MHCIERHLNHIVIKCLMKQKLCYFRLLFWVYDTDAPSNIQSKIENRWYLWGRMVTCICDANAIKLEKALMLLSCQLPFLFMGKFLLYSCWVVVMLLPTAGFEERFQKEAGLCSSAIRPALVKVTCFLTKRDEIDILTVLYKLMFIFSCLSYLLVFGTLSVELDFLTPLQKLVIVDFGLNIQYKHELPIKEFNWVGIRRSSVASLYMGL